MTFELYDGTKTLPPDAPLLGNSARVVVSKETIENAEAPMSKKRRKQLRRELICNYIRSKPAGTRIQDTEFMKVGNFNNPASIHYFIQRMLEDKVIARENITPRTYSYAVLTDAKTITPATPRKKDTEPFNAKVERLAMEFSWKEPAWYNNLHKFVEWLQENEQ